MYHPLPLETLESYLIVDLISKNIYLLYVCWSSFNQIRQIRQIRSSLNMVSAITLANSLVLSKIDYCNSLLFDLPEIFIIPLQRLQNSLARIVCRSSKLKAHTSDLLKRLHWLPVTQRIKIQDCCANIQSTQLRFAIVPVSSACTQCWAVLQYQSTAVRTAVPKNGTCTCTAVLSE